MKEPQATLSVSVFEYQAYVCKGKANDKYIKEFSKTRAQGHNKDMMTIRQGRRNTRIQHTSIQGKRV